MGSVTERDPVELWVASRLPLWERRLWCVADFFAAPNKLRCLALVQNVGIES
jgi:hypothetical protein